MVLIVDIGRPSLRDDVPPSGNFAVFCSIGRRREPQELTVRWILPPSRAAFRRRQLMTISTQVEKPGIVLTTLAPFVSHYAEPNPSFSASPSVRAMEAAADALRVVVR